MAGSPTQNNFSEIQHRLLDAKTSGEMMWQAIIALLQSHESLVDLKSVLDPFFKANPVSGALPDEAEGLRYLRIFYALVCFGYQNTAIKNSAPIELQDEALGGAVRMSLSVLVDGFSFESIDAEKPKKETLKHVQLDSGIHFLAFHFGRVLSVASGSIKPSTQGYLAIVRAFLELNSPAPVSSSPEAGAGFGGGAAAVAFASAACAGASGSAESNVREVASQLKQDYKNLILSLHALKNTQSALFEELGVREKYGNFLRSLQSISDGGSYDLSTITSHLAFHTNSVAPLIKSYKPDDSLLKPVARGFQALLRHANNQQAAVGTHG